MKSLREMLTMRKINLDKLLTIDVGKLESLCLIRRSTLAFAILYCGILIAYLGSMEPWFMWSLSHYYPLIACMLVILAWLMSRGLSERLFTRKSFKYPLIAYTVISLYLAVTGQVNMNGYIRVVFNMIVFTSVFSLDVRLLCKLMRWLCITMAGMMLLSIPFYVLFLMGFNLPNSSVENESLMYSFYNYYFFLLDNRFTDALLPRFHSVFLEPGHLGSACVFLLTTQISNWKKWYNIVLIVTVLITFSLAAYLLMVVVYFISLWLRKKNIPVRLAIIGAVLVAGGIFAYNYNKGDNLFNLYILERLTITDEGKFAGDNRVTDEFDDEFSDFMASGDILFGRKYEIVKYGWGNSGYRVFIYDYGLVFVLLLVIFYMVCSHEAVSTRARISMFALGFATFWARSTLLDYFDFLPLYSFVYVVPYTLSHTLSGRLKMNSDE